MSQNKQSIGSRVIQLCAGILVLYVLVLSLAGIRGNPAENELNAKPWKGATVFELSPERGRFALTYALVERSSFFLSRDLAQFASPDVGYHNGEYVSIFAPLLSLLLAPGYIIGKSFGLAQIGTGVIIALAALINTYLIRAISIKLHAHQLAGTIAGLIFLFATPAFPYALNLYQHHISTLLLLVSIYLYISYQSWFSIAGIFFLSALSIPLDYPNAFLMFPVTLATCGKFFQMHNIKESIRLSISPRLMSALLIVIIPLGLFMYFNATVYGGPFTLSGTVQTLTFNDESGDIKQDLTTIPVNKEIEKQIDDKGTRSATGFFRTRNILNGLYIQFVSPDRGILVYAPLILIGLLGSVSLIKISTKHIPLLMGVIGANIVLYAMWGDPWGGWAFGSRYLIPMYALTSILLAIEITRWRNNALFITFCMLVANYSVAVNSLGALTSIAIPPQIQVLELEKISGSVQKYTFDRSYDLLTQGHISSFMYKEYLSQFLSPFQMYALIVVPILLIISLIFTYLYFQHSTQSS